MRPGPTTRRYFYQARQLQTVWDEQGARTMMSLGKYPGAERHDTVDGPSLTILLGTDDQKSTVVALPPRNPHFCTYSPYGHATADQPFSALRQFKGELKDRWLDGYILGNGYRAFCGLRFVSPDSDSPWGSGGINAYAYCEGDPVNFADPSGHGKTNQAKSQRRAPPTKQWRPAPKYGKTRSVTEIIAEFKAEQESKGTTAAEHTATQASSWEHHEAQIARHKDLINQVSRSQMSLDEKTKRISLLKASSYNLASDAGLDPYEAIETYQGDPYLSTIAALASKLTRSPRKTIHAYTGADPEWFVRANNWVADAQRSIREGFAADQRP